MVLPAAAGFWLEKACEEAEGTREKTSASGGTAHRDQEASRVTGRAFVCAQMRHSRDVMGFTLVT